MNRENAFYRLYCKKVYVPGGLFHTLMEDTTKIDIIAYLAMLILFAILILYHLYLNGVIAY